MTTGIIENLKIVALISLATYPLIKHSSFKRVMLGVGSLREEAIIGLYFGFLSILGRFVGVVVFNQLKIQGNLIGPLAGGMIGGPFVGFLSGIIGAMYRLSINDITRFPDTISVIMAGLAGGLYYLTYKRGKFELLKVYLFGLIVELIRLLLILEHIEPRILAGPYYSMIGIYMIIVNPLGVIILISLVKDIKYNQNLTGANYAEKSLEIARQSLHILRNGYNLLAMQQISVLIYRYVEVSAVVIIDGEGKYVVTGTDRLKKWLSEYYENGNSKIQYKIYTELKQRYSIEIIADIVILKAPLLLNNSVAGELQFIKTSTEIVDTDIKMIEGITSFLSLQIQNTLVNEQEKLLAKWKFNALKAQVNPHFLYNALNVIKTMVRLDAEKSQELIINLADFYRRSLSERGDRISFIEELKLIKSYMNLQEARFGNRISLHIDVDPSFYNFRFPSFTIQPLIENSIIHGLDGDEDSCLNIHLSTRVDNGKFIITVGDNGVGFSDEILVGINDDDDHKHNKSSGIGLKNINMRLRSLYHDSYSFSISNTEEGALVTMTIPIEYEENKTYEN